MIPHLAVISVEKSTQLLSLRKLLDKPNHGLYQLTFEETKTKALIFESRFSYNIKKDQEMLHTKILTFFLSYMIEKHKKSNCNISSVIEM